MPLRPNWVKISIDVRRFQRGIQVGVTANVTQNPVHEADATLTRTWTTCMEGLQNDIDELPTASSHGRRRQTMTAQLP